MKKKKLKLIVIILILLFTLDIFGVIFNNNIIPADKQMGSAKDFKKELINEEITNEERNQIESPKTASHVELEQEYDFSFNTSIDETFNMSWSYNNYQNNTWMTQPELKGYNVRFQLNITNLRNSTNDLVDPDFFAAIVVTFWNFSKIPNKAEYFALSDAPGTGNCTSNGNVYINETYGGYFKIDTAGNVLCTFDAVMYFNLSRSRIVETEFIPTIENTETDLITWELIFSGFSVGGNYRAVLIPENFSDFMLKNVLGKELTYWRPINYTTTPTNIIINELYEEYLIELQTPNYLSIVYNDNLTLPDKNELRLSIACNMGGNLTIYFRNSTGDLTRVSQLVNEDDSVEFNYIMYNDTEGGIGSLEISLINESSKINFGVKTAEITFYKHATVGAYSQNTTAFTDFFVLAAYFDTDKLNWLYYQNSTGKISQTGDWMMNQSLIRNATVTYAFESLFGELDFGYIPGIDLDLYNEIVDLKEFQISPGDYNLTFLASRPGYQNLEFVTVFNISKKEVYVDLQISPLDGILVIEETFAITVRFGISVSYPPYYETFLRTPVNISFQVLKDGIIDDEFLFPNVIESYTISGPMENNSIPGDFILNISIISDYYNGSASVNVSVVKKELDLAIDYDTTILENRNANISWSLEDNSFIGNRENMSLQIILDGQLYDEFNLTSNSTGFAIFQLGAGSHNITYRLSSPFYSAVETIIIEVLGIPISSGGGDDDDDKGEDNLLLIIVISLILFAVSALAIFMMISRSKVKAQRELESELIALKTKLVATENNVSHFETQISEIAGIYWILIIHSEQGTAMVEITEFRFEEVLGDSFEVVIDKGIVRDSALIGGFLTAIRNFSRETSGTSHEYQPIFNSETDYSTIVNDKEVHRRILEGTDYFMAFISSGGTMEISEILSTVNSKFRDGYGVEAKAFLGRISVFKPYKEEVVSYLHDEIRDLQKKLTDERLLLNQYQGHLRQVQEKIGIKKIK